MKGPTDTKKNKKRDRQTTCDSPFHQEPKHQYRKLGEHGKWNGGKSLSKGYSLQKKINPGTNSARWGFQAKK